MCCTSYNTYGPKKGERNEAAMSAIDTNTYIYMYTLCTYIAEEMDSISMVKNIVAKKAYLYICICTDGFL